MKAIWIAVLGTALAAAAFGQGVPLANGAAWFADNSGLPVSGGYICSYLSGTSTASPLYRDAALGNPWTYPCAQLDGSGRIVAFMNPAVNYRLVLTTSTSVTLWSANGIQGAAPGNPAVWAQNGTTVYNSAGSKVCISSSGPCTLALALLNLQGTSSGGAGLLRIDDTSGSPAISLYANGNAAGTYSATSAGLQLLDGTLTSQMTVGTGNVTVLNAGSGSTTLTVQAGTGQSTTNLALFKGTTGTNLAWVDAVGNGVFPGVAVTGTANNAIQAPNGGITGQQLVTTDSLFFIAEPQPAAVSGVNQARIYLDSTTFTLQASVNGGAYAPIGGGGTGGICGLTTEVIFNAATACGHSANLTYTYADADPLLTVVGADASHAAILSSVGFIQSDAGFLATAATATTATAIEAPAGGVLGLSLHATNYAVVGTHAGAPSATSGETAMLGAIYFDTGGTFKGCTAATGSTCNTWTSFAAGSTAAWGSVTAGTNSSAGNLYVGAGTVLGPAPGTPGVVNANQINNGTAPVSGSIWKSNPSGAPVQALASDIVAAFTGCTGSPSQYLAANGTCQTGGGGGGGGGGSGPFITSGISGLATAFAVGASPVNPFVVTGDGTVTSATTINAIGGFHVGLSTVIDSSRNVNGVSGTFATLAVYNNAFNALNVGYGALVGYLSSVGSITPEYGGTSAVVMGSGEWTPANTNIVDLGDSTHAFKNVFANTIVANGTGLPFGYSIIAQNGLNVYGGMVIGATAYGWNSAGDMYVRNMNAGGVAGVTCSGSPTSSFATVNGIVTHC